MSSSDANRRKTVPGTALNLKEAPIVDVVDMFGDMVKRYVENSAHGKNLKDNTFKFRVATLCSGTDAPIFALQLIEKACLALGLGSTVQFEHLYSCEIEPFKQGFIRRNVASSVKIFRDVVEMALAIDGDGMA